MSIGRASAAWDARLAAGPEERPERPEMEEVKPGKWACPVHEDVVVVSRTMPTCAECEEGDDE